MTRFHAILFALGLLGCPPSPTEVTIGESFVLAPGEAAVVDGGGPRVRFAGVLEDSRCPSDVVCVRAGEVVADVRIGEGTPDRVSLRPGESAGRGGYTVHLVAVEPYPTSTTRIEPSRYRATFLVDQAG